MVSGGSSGGPPSWSGTQDECPDSGAGARERGQLILIAAILVALTVVAAVVLLNVIHESPTLQSQAEAQSLTETEQVTDDVRDDFHHLFLTRTAVGQTGEPYPYAEELPAGGYDGQTLTADVEDYDDQHGTVLADNSQTVASVGYHSRFAPGGSMNGSIAFQNQSQQFTLGDPTNPALGSTPAEYVIVNQTSMLPRFNVNVTDVPGPNQNVTFDVTGDDGLGTRARLNVSQESVTYLRGGSVVWQCETLDGTTGPNGYIELDFTDGVGEIRTGDDFCGDLTFARGLTTPLEVTVQNGDNARGTYVVTGASDDPDSDIKHQEAGQEEATWGEFDVAVTTSPSPGPAGETFEFDVEVENVGSVEDTQTIALRRDDTDRVVDARPVTLTPGATQTITLSWDTDGEFDSPPFGAKPVTVTSDSHSDGDQINVQNPGGSLNESDVGVDIVDAPGQLTAGDRLEVRIDATNVGDQTDQLHTIALENEDGNVTDYATVDEPDADYEVILTWGVPQNSSYVDPNYQIRVSGEDDEDTHTLAITEPEPATKYNPFYYDGSSVDPDHKLVVNPRFDVRVDNPDITYTNSYHLYNRTAP